MPYPSRLAARAAFRWLLGLFACLVLAGCTLGMEPPSSGGTGNLPAVDEPEVETSRPPASPSVQPSPTPIPRILTICTGAEPATLFLYGGNSLAQNHILQAIYDGPIDSQGYDFQAVILEKLPDQADGDAAIEPVAVQAGDWVVNIDGERVRLAVGERVRPFGCDSPDCAVAWDGGPLEMPQLSASFTLKEGLTWSDGEPLTAADSAFSYAVAKDCRIDGVPCGGLGLVNKQGYTTLERTADYRALDERSVRWTGLPGFMDPGYRTNFFSPLPQHQLAEISPEQLFTAPEAARQPLGWGPYAITDWIPGDQIRLQRNPSYFRSSEGLPAFDVLVFRFVGPDSRASLEQLSYGMCDLLDQDASLALQEGGIEGLLEAEADGKLKAYISTGTVWEHADFGIRPAAYDDGYQLGVDRPDFFADARVRQAAAQCMDRQRVVETLFSGQSAVPDSYLPPDHPLFNASVSRYPYDPAAGAALLEQAGWRDDDGDPGTPRRAYGVLNVVDGTPLSLAYTTSQAGQRFQAAQILAESLAECGIQVDVQFAEAGEVYAPGPEGPVFGRNFDLAQFSWLTGANPPCDLWATWEIPGDPVATSEAGEPLYPKGWSGRNETGFSNPEYDRACRAALSTLPGQPGYAENHLAAQTIFAAELPVVPLYLRLKLVVTRPDLCGFALDPTSLSEMWNIEAYDYGAGCGG
ncbi:MAG TPA: peptide ABC transporter substrate-binding protein [Anaerolineales bacterium]|nr:peptide ABC transporter substrate-binding protein [Anaerolineales bacterium]